MYRFTLLHSTALLPQIIFQFSDSTLQKFDELEFKFERLADFGLVVELGGVKKDEEREGVRVVGENAAEERIREMDCGGVGGGSERMEFMHGKKMRFLGFFKAQLLNRRLHKRSKKQQSSTLNSIEGSREQQGKKKMKMTLFNDLVCNIPENKGLQIDDLSEDLLAGILLLKTSSPIGLVACNSNWMPSSSLLNLSLELA
ncbi:hypothetical protein AgCh_026523 [Apium graveolens]